MAPYRYLHAELLVESIHKGSGTVDCDRGLIPLLEGKNISSADDQDHIATSVPSAFHGLMGRHIVFLIAKKKTAQQEPKRASRLLGW